MRLWLFLCVSCLFYYFSFINYKILRDLLLVNKEDCRIVQIVNTHRTIFLHCNILNFFCLFVKRSTKINGFRQNIEREKKFCTDRQTFSRQENLKQTIIYFNLLKLLLEANLKPCLISHQQVNTRVLYFHFNTISIYKIFWIGKHFIIY